MVESNIMETFWGLRSEKEETRVEAARQLVLLLSTADPSDVEYALVRLVDGLGSTSVSARLGFLLALICAPIGSKKVIEVHGKCKKEPSVIRNLLVLYAAVFKEKIDGTGCLDLMKKLVKHTEHKLPLLYIGVEMLKKVPTDVKPKVKEVLESLALHSTRDIALNPALVAPQNHPISSMTRKHFVSLIEDEAELLEILKNPETALVALPIICPEYDANIILSKIKVDFEKPLEPNLLMLCVATYFFEPKIHEDLITASQKLGTQEEPMPMDVLTDSLLELMTHESKWLRNLCSKVFKAHVKHATAQTIELILDVVSAPESVASLQKRMEYNQKVMEFISIYIQHTDLDSEIFLSLICFARKEPEMFTLKLWKSISGIKKITINQESSDALACDLLDMFMVGRKKKEKEQFRICISKILAQIMKLHTELPKTMTKIKTIPSCLEALSILATSSPESCESLIDIAFDKLTAGTASSIGKFLCALLPAYKTNKKISSRFELGFPKLAIVINKPSGSPALVKCSRKIVLASLCNFSHEYWKSLVTQLDAKTFKKRLGFE